MSLDEDNAALLSGKGRQSGGGSIDNRDPRFTEARSWVSNIISGLMVLALAGVIKNLIDINLTLRDFANSNTATAAAIADLKAEDKEMRREIRGLDGRVYTLEGRNLRGGTEAKRHGN